MPDTDARLVVLEKATVDLEKDALSLRADIRAQDRQDAELIRRLEKLESQLDELEDKLDSIRKSQMGLMAGIAVGAVMLAVNLVALGGPISKGFLNYVLLILEALR